MDINTSCRPAPRPAGANPDGSCTAAVTNTNVCVTRTSSGLLPCATPARRQSSISASCVLTTLYFDAASVDITSDVIGEVACPDSVWICNPSTSTGVGATAANQTLEIAQLTAINAGVPAALGQTIMLNSMPVVIASDQSPIPVTGTIAVTGTLTDAQLRATPVPVSGTVAVTGGATAANQTLQLAELAAINAGTPAALGQTTMANSASFVLASDQSPIPTNPLKRPATARQLAAIATSSTVQTTAGVLVISMIARGADIRYRVTAVTSTAVAADHLIIQNERLDIAVFSGGFVSAIRDAATSGTLEISELV